ncbi:MAG: 16S rRNA (adenine(1518)-N(6)/adenine(1519)-N(6))-dimethyltransferase RsmA [Acidobacteriota bacterium]|nr:16S rRNA (adenine(1518)-N(6)/adenine(1519)-N(6))-dimethyltransferase RsmA [Acidobacteriota bacterium]
MGADPRLVKPNEPGAKKRFGQHFLRDTGVLDRITRWIQPSSGDLFLDIGAGAGALSLRLIPKAARLLSIEIDEDCIPQLQESLSPFPNAVVISGDFLQLKLEDLLAPYLQPGFRLRIAGNLPYNIATAIIERLLHANLPVYDMSFMVQLEVAQRITALPGKREYGYFSVECQHHAEVRFGFKVSPACFVPRPNVVSAMVSFHPKSSSLDSTVEPYFEMLTKAAFSYRRKTLENSLSRHPVLHGFSSLLLKRAGISGSRRAEALSVQEFEHLARVYSELRSTTDP